jgi:pimeloyl-ACP methyl ester carboxylesterase
MYDARGHGYSDKPDGPYDLATHVADLVGLIRALGLEKPVLMGHSMGGGTVALAAATHPDLARAVILEDPADMLARLEPLGEAIIPDRKKHLEIARLLPKGRLVHIDGAGHVIRNDRPAATEREIRAFLAGL